MNDYEREGERLTRAMTRLAIAQDMANRIMAEADAEYRAAEKNLRQYEESPGIPLEQYR